jgi:hypothetical protein
VPADPAEHRFVLHESFPAEAARHVQHIERRRVPQRRVGRQPQEVRVRIGGDDASNQRRRITALASDREAGGCTSALGQIANSPEPGVVGQFGPLIQIAWARAFERLFDNIISRSLTSPTMTFGRHPST